MSWRAWYGSAVVGALGAHVYVAGCAGVPAAQGSHGDGRPYEFVNGRWSDGMTFQGRVMYAVNGVLTRRRPVRLDETVDLQSGFVVPPFGEAHNHKVEGPRDVDARVRRYLRDGIFYVKITNSIRDFTVQIAHRLKTPASIDVVFANAGLTATGGHPIALAAAVDRQPPLFQLD